MAADGLPFVDPLVLSKHHKATGDVADTELRRCVRALDDIVVDRHPRDDLITCVMANRACVSKLMPGDDAVAVEFGDALDRLILRLPRQHPDGRREKMRPWGRLLMMVVYCSVSFVISTTIAFSNESIKQSYRVRLPMLVSLAMSLAFVLNGLVWAGLTLHARRSSSSSSSAGSSMDSALPFRRRLRAYVVLGAVDAIHLMLQANALNALPASVYTLLKGSGIIFSVCLSKLVVRKVFLLWHWIAVALMIVATTGCALLTSLDGERPGADASVAEFLAGFVLTLSSSFLVALLGVLQQKLMANVKHSSATMVTIAEANFFQSLLTFPVIVVFIAFMPEWRQWMPIWRQLAAEDRMTGYVAFLVAIAGSRSLIVFAAMGLTTLGSAMFSRSYNALRQSAQVIFLSLVFAQ